MMGSLRNSAVAGKLGIKLILVGKLGKLIQVGR